MLPLFIIPKTSVVLDPGTSSVTTSAEAGFAKNTADAIIAAGMVRIGVFMFVCFGIIFDFLELLLR